MVLIAAGSHDGKGARALAWVGNGMSENGVVNRFVVAFQSVFNNNLSNQTYILVMLRAMCNLLSLLLWGSPKLNSLGATRDDLTIFEPVTKNLEQQLSIGKRRPLLQIRHLSLGLCDGSLHLLPVSFGPRCCSNQLFSMCANDCVNCLSSAAIRTCSARACSNCSLIAAWSTGYYRKPCCMSLFVLSWVWAYASMSWAMRGSGATC